MKPVYLLTGQPGTGKTSLVKQAVAESAISAGGFYTEEIRMQGTRVGFKMVTLDGRKAVLSHVDFNKRYRIGKYGVDIDILEEVGVTSIKKAAADCDLVIIDEIGRMEMLSADFRDAVREIIERDKKILGTIMQKADPFADEIKRRPQVKLLTLSRDNYDRVLDEVKKWMTTGISPADQLN